MPEQDAHGNRASVDVRVPSSARIYDYLLGGKDNFPADRAAAEELKTVAPDIAEHARANRRFVCTAVRIAAEAGIRQFVDLGTGIPTSPNVHEVARSVHPAARTVYVDNDPIVSAHNRAWRSRQDGIGCIEADIRDPEPLLAHPELTGLIDPGEPVAVLMTAVLHFTENAEMIAGTFRAWMASGSVLVISVGTSENPPDRQRSQFADVFDRTTAQVVARTRQEIEALFDGLELLEPGVVETDRWRNPNGRSFPAKTLAGVGRKP
ncbi:SAM-dependent methyltransferase [Actinomadura sp. HBU206391]|uniref:SAM-dependent methyltransferase n=1 Tax=Actinomadura sp. HBU206391 TaxID=2731692 RepID=UPI0016501C40|nr:SAM-dependent methyltransferase [Actinomadura sp. HBU206391]MBC6458009.1 SAM-dependent methyltransferase [Actinomadura sp. HBU206391]